MVDLLILVNRVQALKRSNIGSAVLEDGRSNDIIEFCFQSAKCTDMDFDEKKGSLFDDSLEWYYHAVICSDKRSTLLQVCRIADVSESSFQVRNVEICTVQSSNNIDVPVLRIRIFSSHEITWIC